MHTGTDDRTATPALLGLVWSAMFGFSGFFLSYSTMVSIGAAGGLSTVTGGTVLTTMMVGVIAVQPLAPRLGRRLGLRSALLLALGLQLLGQVLGLLIVPALLSLVLAGVSGGMGFGLFVVLANAAVPGTVPPHRLGRALGIFGGTTSLAAAVGAPLGLWLIGVLPVSTFRLIACATLLLAVPTLVKFMPGRGGVVGARGGVAGNGGVRDGVLRDAAGSGGARGDAAGNGKAGGNGGASSRQGEASEDGEESGEDRTPGALGESGEPGKSRVVDSHTQRAVAHPAELDAESARAAELDVESGHAPEYGHDRGRPGPHRIREAIGLGVMLCPFLVGMVTFGLIVGFGPGREITSPAIFIAIMQVSAVIGRFAAGAVADARSPLMLNFLGVGLTACGLMVTALTGAGVVLAVAMALVGFGLGTLQSASLVMAFTAASTPARASVWWNMCFDIGLGIAGVIGGIGFTYLGDTGTFLFCAGVLLLVGMVSWFAAARRTPTAE